VLIVSAPSIHVVNYEKMRFFIQRKDARSGVGTLGVIVIVVVVVIVLAFFGFGGMHL
jgi:hypothetical protein